MLTVQSYRQAEDVVLAVSDEGCGIKPEDMHQIGTPFYTTKSQGTGLGLAMCYRIAAAHQAKIEIESSATGTTVLVRFHIPQNDSLSQ